VAVASTGVEDAAYAGSATAATNAPTAPKMAIDRIGLIILRATSRGAAARRRFRDFSDVFAVGSISAAKRESSSASALGCAGSSSLCYSCHPFGDILCGLSAERTSR
jgi:hypothetical protein